MRCRLAADMLGVTRAEYVDRYLEVWEELITDGGRIVYLIMDGLGDLPEPDGGRTALGIADTPNLDDLARRSACGLLEMVGPGLRPAAARAISRCSAMTRCAGASAAACCLRWGSTFR
jgi:hypothetical protein